MTGTGVPTMACSPSINVTARPSNSVTTLSVLIVESYLPDRVTRRERRRIVDCLCSVARATRQDALLVAVDGRPFLITGHA